MGTKRLQLSLHANFQIWQRSTVAARREIITFHRLVGVSHSYSPLVATVGLWRHSVYPSVCLSFYDLDSPVTFHVWYLSRLCCPHFLFTISSYTLHLGSVVMSLLPILVRLTTTLSWLSTTVYSTCSHQPLISGRCPCQQFIYIYIYIYIWQGHTVTQMVEAPEGHGLDPRCCHWIFQWRNSGHTVFLGSTQPVKEISSRMYPGQCAGPTKLPASCADCLEIWEPQPPGTHVSRTAIPLLDFYLYRYTSIVCLLSVNACWTKLTGVSDTWRCPWLFMPW